MGRGEELEERELLTSLVPPEPLVIRRAPIEVTGHLFTPLPSEKELLLHDVEPERHPTLLSFQDDTRWWCGEDQRDDCVHVLLLPPPYKVISKVIKESIEPADAVHARDSKRFTSAGQPTLQGGHQFTFNGWQWYLDPLTTNFFTLQRKAIAGDEQVEGFECLLECTPDPSVIICHSGGGTDCGTVIAAKAILPLFKPFGGNKLLSAPLLATQLDDRHKFNIVWHWENDSLKGAIARRKGVEYLATELTLTYRNEIVSVAVGFAGTAGTESHLFKIPPALGGPRGTGSAWRVDCSCRKKTQRACIFSEDFSFSMRGRKLLAALVSQPRLLPNEVVLT